MCLFINWLILCQPRHHLSKNGATCVVASLCGMINVKLTKMIMATSFTMFQPLADGWCDGIYPFKIMPCLLLFPFQISAVRAVVPNKSNNEIVLVLQHFENCVDKAVHAFLEGMNGTTTILWAVVIVGKMSLGCILLTWNVPTTLWSWFWGRGGYSPLFTEPEVNNCFSIYYTWAHQKETR